VSRSGVRSVERAVVSVSFGRTKARSVGQRAVVVKTSHLYPVALDPSDHMTEELSRRGFLAAAATAGTAALAGCGSVSGDGTPERELVLNLSRVDGTLRENHVTDLEATELPWDEAAFEAARNGEEYTTQYRKPFYADPEDPVYVLRDGTYYECGSVVVDEVTTTHPVLRLHSVDSTTATPADGPGPAAASDLPEADQRAVRVAHRAARARDNAGGASWGIVQRGGYVFRDETAIADSELLAEDGPAQVTYRETVYEVDVTEERFHEPVYRATVEPVADSPERMEAILRARFVDARFTREDLSRDARDVLREAETADGGYAETHSYSSGFEEVLRALHARAYIDGNIQKDAGGRHEGRSTIRYDGTYFDYTLRFRSSDG
jgi:hypothetical protein